ncbi:TPA: hypothetical protein DDW35_05665 [Candidatus Sumerlaeota bacterium]|jgi:hypothetical protein|nr:hypothetical protein [Candidatus Sumerlaeota bacterium]
MNEPVELAKNLASSLSEHRLQNLENELAHIVRKLPAEHKLEVIYQLMPKNVRAAAAIAARGQLPVSQQVLLLQNLLESSGTNAIKVMVYSVFAHRMRAELFLRILKEKQIEFPKGVYFAAYYYLHSENLRPKIRDELHTLFEATRPLV